MRLAGNAEVTGEAALKRLKEEGTEFTLFGGEPLLSPLNELEEFFKYGYEKFKKNNIQTNGTLISTGHISMFKRYNVHVGISVDGPGELNDARQVASLAVTRRLTDKTIGNIKLLRQEGISVSIITTLHKLNANEERIGRLIEWFEELDALGITAVRLHFLELDNGVVHLRLEDDQCIRGLLSLYQKSRSFRYLRFDIFSEMRRVLLGDFKDVSCIWHGCDPYTTPAVRGIDRDGSLHNCGRTNKDGVAYRKSTTASKERTIALYYTPYSAGGCQGCRFFYACKGECPGTAIEGDWRNRTDHCEVLIKLFEHLEDELVREGKYPVSTDNVRREVLEKEAISGAVTGNWHIDEHLDTPHLDYTFLGVVPVIHG